MPILIIVQITLGKSTNLKDARMMAASVVINTIDSDDRHVAEGQRNIRRRPLADGS